MPNYVNWFVDRKKQVDGFLKMVARETKRTIMAVDAPSEMGKTWLIHKIRHYCEENNIPVTHIDFRDRREYDYLSLVRFTRDQMGGDYFNHLTQVINTFTSVNVSLHTAGGGGGVNVAGISGGVEVAGDIAGRDMIKDNKFFVQADSRMTRRAAELQINDAFFQCLNNVTADHPVAVFLFDSYEQITTEAERWLLDYLLFRLREGLIPNVLVLIAGQKMPAFDPEIKPLVAKTGLNPFTLEDIQEYITERRQIDGLDIETIHKTSGGFPGLLAKMADVAAIDTEEDDDWLN